ncbi:MAG: hypothetical protein E7562_02795 [Ruminococcaceae bacterium]|nr:hypothetical protein [Oscillospiraceae bacterium]
MSKRLSVCTLLDIYGSFLSEKQRTLTGFYYNDDLSLSEIAENEGITRQAVSELIRRTENQLEYWEQQCKYCEKFSLLKKLSQKARNGDTDSTNAMFDIIDEL